MAKITKSMLKEIVKECLVEILVEGIAPESGEDTLTEAFSARKPVPKAMASKRRPTKKQEPVVSESVISQVSNGDSVMADIFADTARNTLAKQGMSATSGPGYIPADAAAAAAHNSELEDLFEGVNNWATLAFAQKKPPG
jgi:hypothetical protein